MPEPLHPALVHFPIALAVIAPLVALCAWIALMRGTKPGCAFAAVLATQVLLSATGFVAKQTGGGDEKRVEKVVAHEVVHEHEEAADRFVFATFGAALLAALGMLGNALGKGARVLHALACVAVLWFGYQAGSSGGELVWVHGAAEAYRGG